MFFKDYPENIEHISNEIFQNIPAKYEMYLLISLCNLNKFGDTSQRIFTIIKPLLILKFKFYYKRSLVYSFTLFLKLYVHIYLIYIYFHRTSETFS